MKKHCATRHPARRPAVGHPSKGSLVKWTFVHDQLATGRKRHVLTIIDRFSGYSPAIESRFMWWRYSGRWCPDGVGRTGAAVQQYSDRVNADRALRTHPRLTHGW
jgi:hypothetical protein